MDKTGFIGLGMMGQGMAGNLLRAGYPLTVWNRSPEKSAALLEQGARAGDSPAAVAAASDLIFVCVSDTPDVEAVILGPDGVLQGAQAGSLVIDHSTISPAATRLMAARLAEIGVGMLDAPVSGGPEGAQQGTLSIMVGGDEVHFQRALPALQVMGRNITHLGAVGAGQTAKLVNQIIVVVTMLGVAEGLLFAQAGGLDLQRCIEAIAGGAAGSWMLSKRGVQAAVRDWRPGFTIDLQQKDLRLVLEAADQWGVPLLGTGTVFQLYRTLQQQGLGAEGNHALVKALENLAGYTIGPATS